MQRISVLFLLSTLFASAAHAQAIGDATSPTYTEFSASGAGTGTYQGTVCTSINSKGVITGGYSFGSNVTGGFVRAATSPFTITEFSAPDAGTGKNQGTFPFSVNTAGTIAGMYSDDVTAYRGFVRAATSPFTITEYDAPCAGTTGHRGSVPLSINTAGTITGVCKDSGDVHHGFVRSAKTPFTITDFDVPAAGTAATQGTNAISINTAGVITGSYKDSSSLYHGFVRAANGTITAAPIDAPGAGQYSGGIKDFCCGGTYAMSINTAGEITGFYTDTNGVYHGFVRAATTPFAITDFNAAGAGTGALEGTFPVSINTAGEIAGFYIDSTGTSHGFVRAAKSPYAITSFDAPGVAGTGIIHGTFAFSINTAGDIVGTYTDSSDVFHCFLRNPK